MRKWTVLLAFVLSLTTLAGCAMGAAEAVDYEAYLPDGAKLLNQEREDGGTELTYEGASGEKYELLVGADGVAFALETKLKRPAGEGASVALTQDAAFERILSQFPDAQLRSAATDQDDSRQVWVLIFTSGNSLYECEMDAADGFERETTRFFSYTPDADPVAQILLSYPGAEITELEPDLHNGKPRYTGSARVAGIGYDFTVDSATGQLLEWEMDD